MKHMLLAQSSSGDPHKVEFVIEGDSVRVFCHCEAGIRRQLCKHKIALIAGTVGMLADPDQASILEKIRAWSQMARLKKCVEEYIEIVKMKDKATERQKAAKEQLEKEFFR